MEHKLFERLHMFEAMNACGRGVDACLPRVEVADSLFGVLLGRLTEVLSSLHSLGRVEISHPPPIALISSTFASIRRLMRSISFRSFARAVVREVTTWR